MIDMWFRCRSPLSIQGCKVHQIADIPGYAIPKKLLQTTITTAEEEPGIDIQLSEISLGTVITRDPQFPFRRWHISIKEPLQAQNDPQQEVVCFDRGTKDKAFPLRLKGRLFL